jgi:hypothetical protein
MRDLELLYGYRTGGNLPTDPGLFSSNKRLIMQEFSYSFRKRLRLCIKGVPFVSRPDHLDTYRGSTLPRSIPQTHTAHSRNILK